MITVQPPLAGGGRARRRRRARQGRRARRRLGGRASCDAAGWPIVVKRPDNAKPTSVEIAINKAFTAACHRRPTHTYTNAQPGQEAFGIMNMHSGRFAIFVGGWPIEIDGEVVGGIGVSRRAHQGGHRLLQGRHHRRARAPRQDRRLLQVGQLAAAAAPTAD